MTKAEIRTHIAQQKRAVQGFDRLSARIVKRIEALALFQTATTVGVYLPLPDEVDIRPLFQPSASTGISPHQKTFYIPAFDENSGTYRLANHEGKLKRGKFRIPEPEAPQFAPPAIDLILVPGIAFDRAGNRVGRGGGFYDQLLPLYRATTLGVCFDLQRIGILPVEPHDRALDFVISESEIS